MVNQLSFTVFKTRAGWVGVLGSPAGLRRVTLPQPSAAEARRALGKEAGSATRSLSLFPRVTEQIKAYYSGKAESFALRLDLSGGTAFQRAVWVAARTIPYGETRSYGWLARQIGRPRAARAVGQALGANPFLVVVPCHRVLAGDGGLGGFGGGLAMKRRLLSLEKGAATRKS